MEYPEIIYLNELIGTYGVHCLTYQNYDDQPAYIKQSEYLKIEDQRDKLLGFLSDEIKLRHPPMRNKQGARCYELMALYEEIAGEPWDSVGGEV